MTTPEILELRVHGVNNTSPANMLELPADAVEMVSGDKLGSFWRAKASVLPAPPKQSFRNPPPGVAREAYSWGGMARTSIGSSSGVGKFAAMGARFGWTLLLPFSLLNIAYWSRRLDSGPPTGEAGVEKVGGRGGGIVRICALLLTLLLAVTVSVIVLDLISVQCYADPTAPCTKLPSFFDFLRSWEVARRLALMSTVPIIAAVALYALTIVTKVRYTDSTENSESDAAGTASVDSSEATPVWPLLRTKGFWNSSALLGMTAKLHLAAVAVLVAGLTAWHTAYEATGRSCSKPNDVIKPGCWDTVRAVGPHAFTELVVVGACVVAMGIIVTLVAWGRQDAVDLPQSKRAQSRATFTNWFVLGCGALYVTQLLLLTILGSTTTDPAKDADRLIGISALPAIIIVFIIWFALCGLTWRYVDNNGPFLLGLVFVISLALSSLGDTDHHLLVTLARCFAGASLAAMVAIVVVVGRPRGQRRLSERRFEAWDGCAPGIFMLLALLFSMLLSSATVVVVGNLFNGRNSSASLAGGPVPATPASTGCNSVCEVKDAPHLELPLPYVWFGALLIPFVIAFVVLVAVAAGVTFRRRGVLHSALDQRGDGRRTPLRDKAVQARWFAAFAHRAEKLVALLATLGGAALIVSVAAAIADWDLDNSGAFHKGLQPILGFGMVGLALAGAGVVALTAGGAAVGNTRPLGLIWDLCCLLPKTAHPFGPPCYAERVVPELVGRCKSWINVESDSSNGRVILSAHSLGAVLAVATIFSLSADDSVEPDAKHTPAEALEAVSLLTYGVQLRAYFGRIFPELLGPEILGGQPCRAPKLFAGDPWSATIAEETAEPAELQQSSLRATMGAGKGTERWISLWRRTDYLGFPAVQYAPGSPTDRAADEIDRSGFTASVGTHSDYPRTAQYAVALNDLIQASPSGASAPEQSVP
jgi:hypothetical protein